MTALLLLLLPGARGAEFASEIIKTKSRFLNIVILTSVLVAVLIGINGILNITKTAILRSIGRVTLCEMETYDADATCRIAEIVNVEAAPEERIFLAAYYRYWYRPDIIQCLNSTHETEELSAIAEADSAWIYIYEHGYRYVVIDEITHATYLETLVADQTPEWLQVETIFDAWPFVVYRLDSLDPSRMPDLICSQVDPPAWEVVPTTGR